ncbi:hypothetical protein ACWX0O_01850 [Nitrobacteraceae bacterium UC4449_H16]
MSWTYEATRKGYAKMWDRITIKATDAVSADKFAKKIIAGKSKYLAVSRSTGVPWYFIGALHMRESSCNFNCVLHNGEKIIGTTRKTKLVPKGRGPFKTWQAAAIDALTLKNLKGISWCPARMAFEGERYNGLGYIAKGVNSPYLWAGSNHEQGGKYVADHKFDRSADDTQIGVMTVLKALSQMDSQIAAEINIGHEPPMSTTKKTTIGGVVAGGVVATGTAASTDAQSTLDQLSPVINVFQNYGTTIAVVFTVALVVGAVGWHFYQKYQAGPQDAEVSI